MCPESTINSTIMGKAYEYACVLALVEEVSPRRSINVIENESLTIAKGRFENDISSSDRTEMLSSAVSGIKEIVSLEPRIVEDGNDELTVSIQPDLAGTCGDVRDILIVRRSLNWEIGISVKHNHEALKHSRLATNLDFGNSWYGVSCSQEYVDEIAPIFSSLRELQNNGMLWREIGNKEDNVYVPLLNAFISEVKRAYQNDGDKITKGLIKYLLGSNGNDYYKLIHYNNHVARIIPYNLYGTLNQSSSSSEPVQNLPEIELPTRIIEFTIKEGSKTTAVLTMDNGWSISFRIHNASSTVEPSLKFDIQLIGQPSSLFFIDIAW